MTHLTPEFAHTLFGVSRGLEQAERDAIRGYLHAAWIAQYGRMPSTLSVDLETLSALFRSHVQAKRLRDAAEDLDIIALRRPLLPEAVFVPVDDRRGFVTPEGRVLLEELESGDNSSDQILTRDSLLRACAIAADFYGSHQRRWMRKELAGGDVRPGTLGFILFLLINNSIGFDHALFLPSSQSDEEALARTILPVVNKFSVSVGGSAVRPRESERLRSNWIVTEAKRQMPRHVSRLDDKRVITYWIEPSSEFDLIDELGFQIARRRMVTVDILDEALRATLSEYELARPMLASWGLSHERAGHTQRVFDALLSAYTSTARV